MRLVLTLILILCASYVSAEPLREREGVTVGLWNSLSHPLKEASHSILPQQRYAPSLWDHARIQDPLFIGLAMSFDSPRASFAIIKPILAPGLGLNQTWNPLLQSEHRYPGQPGLFDGLVSFVGALRLNLGSPYDAQEGFTWSVAFSPPQNGHPDIGMALRYKRKF